MSISKIGGRTELVWGAEGTKKKRKNPTPRSPFSTEMGDWRELSYCFWWLRAAAILANLSGMVQEDLLPYLRQTLIYLRCCAPTANNQLKLAYFFTFVTEPDALSQLCLSKQESADLEKVLESLFLRISPLHIISSPSPPSAVFMTLLSFVTLKFWAFSGIFCR